MIVSDRSEHRNLTVTLRSAPSARVSKGDGPTAAAGPFILRGSLALAPQDDGSI